MRTECSSRVQLGNAMRKDTLVAAAYEAGLLGFAALLGYFLHSPLIFTSLGPTAYEMIETPTRPSARTYNVLVGHSVGIVAGLVALGSSHAWAEPAVSLHGVPLQHVVAVLIAGFLTVVGTLMLKATQPASLSTTLLIGLGTMQTWHAVLSIAVSVGVMAADSPYPGASYGDLDLSGVASEK